MAKVKVWCVLLGGLLSLGIFAYLFGGQILVLSLGFLFSLGVLIYWLLRTFHFKE